MSDRDPIDAWFGERPPNTNAVEPASIDTNSASSPADSRLDRHGAMTTLHHALAWAARGFRVFPLAPGRKTPPKGLAWKDEATVDPIKIRAWWAFEPAYNYAVAAGAGTLILDVDAGKNGYASLLEIDLPPTLTVKTPGGGEHQYFTGPDVQNSVDRIAPGLDIRSAGGYVVGPGSYFADAESVSKGYTGHWQVLQDMAPVPAPEAFVLLCGQGKERERDRSPAAAQDQPEDIARAREHLANAEPATEGRGGDLHTYKVACTLRDLGLSEETALAMMAGHWNERCLPPWSRDELAAKVANAFSYGQNRPAANSLAAVAEAFGGDPGDVLTPSSDAHASAAAYAAASAVCDEDTLAALLAASPLLGKPIFAGQPRSSAPWLVKGVIPRTGVGVIYGKSTGGKSYLVMDLAAKLWRGQPWFGAKIPEAKATVIFAYEGADFAGRRLDALQRAAGGERPAIIVVPAGRMTAAGLKSLVPQLRGIDACCKAVFGLAIGLVVIDTVSAAGLAEKEDKADDVAPAVKAVQEFAGTVGAFGLLVHHPNKAGDDMRGSGVWFNNADAVLRLDVTEGHPVRTLAAEKVKDGQPRELGAFMLESMTLGIDDDGDPVTACVVISAEKPSRRTADGIKHFDKFVRAFEEAADKRGASLKGMPIAPLSEVEERFKEAVAPHYSKAGSVRMVWKRCRDHAEEAGIIRPVRGERNSYALTQAAYAPEDPNAIG